MLSRPPLSLLLFVIQEEKQKWWNDCPYYNQQANPVFINVCHLSTAICTLAYSFHFYVYISLTFNNWEALEVIGISGLLNSTGFLLRLKTHGPPVPNSQLPHLVHSTRPLKPMSYFLYGESVGICLPLWGVHNPIVDCFLMNWNMIIIDARFDFEIYVVVCEPLFWMKDLKYSFLQITLFHSQGYY